MTSARQREDVSRAVIVDGKGSAVELNGQPTVGVYVFGRKDLRGLHRACCRFSVTFSAGLQYFPATKAPNPETIYATRSGSKRSSGTQVRV